MNRYFEYPLERRLAFREFGTSLGLNCALSLSEPEEEDDLVELSSSIIDQWEQAGIVSSGTVDCVTQRQSLEPITKVMYAAALVPGGE